MLLVQDRYLVLTPEKVVVSYDLGSVGSRIMAELIDLLAIGVMTIAIGIGLSLLGVVAESLATALFLIVAAFGMLGYHAGFEAFAQGQTPGKRAMKIRVVNVDGTPVTFRAALLRNLMRPADMLPVLYLAGLTMLFLNPKAQRIGDLVAGTVVIRTPAAQQGYTPAPHHVGLHPLEATVGELAGMTLDEYNAIKRLCDRFPYLTQSEQAESISDIWLPFAERNHILPLPNVHPVYQMEAVVMKYGRQKRLV